MGKHKFIDKKNAATYHILARDSSDPNYSAPGPASDRVFVRVDNNHKYNVHGFSDEEPEEEHQNDDVLAEDPNSIFADAAGEYDEYDATVGFPGSSSSNGGGSSLPDHVRREIIELGFPDDGYNYLAHLREIKNSGGGSFYYENPKAKFEQLPPDVKAYNASKVEVPRVIDDSDETSLHTAASEAVKTKIERVVDDEIAALLDDDSDASRFGSDVEDLEEDFVVKANLPEGPVDLDLNRKLRLHGGTEVRGIQKKDLVVPGAQERLLESMFVKDEKQRIRRTLDDQFDMLEHQEYGSESEDEYGDYDVGEDELQESLAEKLNHALKHNIPVDGMGDKYIGPSDLLQNNKGLEDYESPESAAVVIQRTKEYGETLENQSDDEKEVVFMESSDESEAWDCETIVSTYSVLENHPGKIETPGARRKKKLPEASPGNIIALKGKEKLPVDFLPSRKIQAGDKVKVANVPKPETIKRKKHSQESKDEKKERKASVKEERREARKTKKEIRGLYKNEVQRAQKFAAVSGPSSVHIM